MIKNMRIVIIGQAAFGESVLNTLVEHDENIAGVFCSPDKEGRPLDPIKTAAQAYDIPVFQFKRMRNKEAIDAFKALNADLCVMAFVTDIVPDAILEAPTHGSIQYHPSLLPKHRGPSSINWPIIQGETKTGLSIFWPDKGLDTGPILLQKETEITADDTLGSVYFDRLFPMGVEAMADAVKMVKEGTAPKIVQDESEATYEGWCQAEDVVVDWNKSVDEIYNLIRGSEPVPGAGSTYNGSKIQFYKVQKQSGDTGSQPGTVFEVSDKGFLVAAAGGAILVGRVQPEGARKIMAPDWIASVNLKPGDKFGR